MTKGSPAGMEIRPLCVEDTEDVVNLWRECGLVVPWNDPYKDIERKLAVDPDLFVVGEAAGTIVAAAMGGYEGHRGWINYLAVAPAHRDRGGGRALIEHLELLLARRGCPKINVQVRGTNKEAAGFYRALGYRDDDTIALGKRLKRDD